MNTPPGRVVCPLSFQTIRMADIVLVLLIELVILHRTKRPPPKRNSLVYRQTKNLLHLHHQQTRTIRRYNAPHLQEKPILKTPMVLQVLVPAQTLVQMAHAHREVFPRHTVDHVRCYFVAYGFGRRSPLGGDARQEAL